MHRSALSAPSWIHIRRLHVREARFVAAIAVTGLLLALYLGETLRLAEAPGSGWRKVDLQALQSRIGSGDLRDREAEWYRTSSERGSDRGGTPWAR